MGHMEREFCDKRLLWICLAAIAGVLALVLFACCVRRADVPALAPTPLPTETPAQTAAPVVTQTELAPLPLPDKAEIPAQYTVVTEPCLGGTPLAFTDQTGARQYRLYAGVSVLTDGVVTEQRAGFYPALVRHGVNGHDSCACWLDPDGIDCTESDALLAGQCAAEPLPEGMALRPGYYAATKTGLVIAPLVDAPYLVYGRFPGRDPAFYPADAWGSMLPGALPAEETVLLPGYTPLDVPGEGATRRLVVYIGSQSVVAFRAAGGYWQEERVMICSTGKSKTSTPRGEHVVGTQYEYHKLGSPGSVWYGQYATRIGRLGYLFHSVPIYKDAGFSKIQGRRRMSTAAYEKLGTPASGGCIRMLVADAKWIFDNCPKGTPIRITDDAGPEPPEPPALIYERPYLRRAGQGWDPTDPDPDNPYLTLANAPETPIAAGEPTADPSAEVEG